MGQGSMGQRLAGGQADGLQQGGQGFPGAIRQPEAIAQVGVQAHVARAVAQGLPVGSGGLKRQPLPRQLCCLCRGCRRRGWQRRPCQRLPI